MDLRNQTPFEVVYLPGRMNYPDHSVTFIVKGTFDLVAGGTAQLSQAQMPIEGDLGYPDDEEGTAGLRYDSDFVHFKPNADAVLVGKCHPPGGRPVTSCAVSFQVGTRTRNLVVYGERLWKKGMFSTKPSDPQAFQEADLRYDRSYGGPGYALNPIGKGIKVLEVQGHRVQLLPNIEDPRFLLESPKNEPPPAGFGPLSRTWGLRVGKMGTYGARWFKERGPWFPKDMDWSTCNCAPPEMQFPEYLRGDETVRLVNIHPTHETFESRLPGLRTRCFAFFRPSSGSSSGQPTAGGTAPASAGAQSAVPSGTPPRASICREVEMKLDTLWVDAEAGRLVLVWRGHTQVVSDELEDVACAFVVNESTAAAPRLKEGWEQELRPLVPSEETADDDDASEGEPSVAGVASERDGDDDEDDDFADDAEIPPPGPPPWAELDDDGRKNVVRVMRILGQTDDEILAVGLVPKDLPPDTPEERRIMEQLATELGITPDVDAEEEEAEAEGWTRGKVSAHASAGGSFAEESLRRLDLSELALEGIDFTGADLSGANLAGAKLAGSRFGGAILNGANLVGADLRGASLTEASLAGADLTRATLAEADLTLAVFGRAVCREANFEGVDATDASFFRADLQRANFGKAKLGAAGFREAKLDHARFAEAHLESAELSGARADEGAVFDRADLTEALFGPGTHLVGASFQQVRAPRSVWSGAKLSRSNFSHAVLVEANLSKAELDGALLHAVDAKACVLYKTVLRGAKVTSANLFKAIVNFTDLRQADLTGSNLYGADLSDSIRDGVVVNGAIVDKTILDEKMV
ncbi:MAG: DUF2169 domain-containing protein [Candidatus Eisenbacteria bacterium]